MEPSDKMSALKLAALGLKKVKEDAEVRLLALERPSLRWISLHLPLASKLTRFSDLGPTLYRFQPSAIAGSSNQRLSKSPPASVAPQSPPSATPSVTDASSPTASSSKTAAADAVPQPKPKQPTFSSFTSSGFGSVAASGSSTAFSAFANAKPFGSTAGSSSTANAAGTFGDILSKGGRTSKADEAAGEGVEESGVKADAAGEASDPADDSEGDGVVKLAAQDSESWSHWVVLQMVVDRHGPAANTSFDPTISDHRGRGRGHEAPGALQALPAREGGNLEGARHGHLEAQRQCRLGQASTACVPLSLVSVPSAGPDPSLSLFLDSHARGRCPSLDPQCCPVSWDALRATGQVGAIHRV